MNYIRHAETRSPSTPTLRDPMTRTPRLFLLSPATLSGVRGRRVLEGRSEAPFMPTLLEGGAVPLGDVYAFISSLYYRGKRRYARRFGHRPGGRPPVLAITPRRGLVPEREGILLEDLRAFAETEIDPANPPYLEPLLETARALDRDLPGEGRVVLLGSIATGKYLDPLVEVFGRRLLFPAAFVGRGDMSRGGLLLRAVEARRELDYVVAADAERRGSRPPRLPRRPSCPREQEAPPEGRPGGVLEGAGTREEGGTREGGAGRTDRG